MINILIEFMFQLNEEELQNLMSQNMISSQNHGGTRKLPYVFTEQGVSMLSAVLKSDVAIQVSIEIIKNFVAMKTMIQNNSLMFERFERIEHRLTVHDSNFDKLFDAIEQKELKPSHGIFYNGQVFDAHNFMSDIVRDAKKSIVLIDNYVDDRFMIIEEKRKADLMSA